MYEIPSRQDIKQVVIDAQTIRERKRSQALADWDMEKIA